MHQPIVVPKLNENDDDVDLIELLIPEGGHVEKDDPLFSVETSKSAVEVTAEREGYVHWSVAAGSRVPMPSEIGIIADSKQELEEVAATSESRSAASRLAPDRQLEESPRASRAAQELAAELGLNLGDIQSRGPIREVDVRRFAEAGMGKPPDSSAVAPQAQPHRAVDAREPEFPGKIDPEFYAQIEKDPGAFGALSSEFKVWLYRKHGAAIGSNVRIGNGSVLVAQYIELGDDTVLEERVEARCRRFSIGQLGTVGSGCRFICRDFVAGDVVALRWNVAVVDGQGGVHDCRIGDLSFVAYDTYLNTDRDVTLGERVCLAPGVRLYTHRKWLDVTDGYPFAYAPVVISNGCWLGSGAVVLPGVTLSEEVTLMANSVAANNAPAGALVGGVPAKVIVRRQKTDLDPARRAQVLIEVLGGNVESFEREGWSVTEESVDGSVWVGRLTGGGQSALVLAAQSKEAVSTVLDNEKRLILVVYQDGGLIEERTGLTVFDLRAKRVQGTRDGASDIVRKLLEQYGVLFEPRLWAYGFRLHEENY